MENKFNLNSPENKASQPSSVEQLPQVEESRVEKENLLARQATAVVERWGRLDDRKREWFFREFWKQLESAQIWEYFRRLGLRFDNPVGGIDFSILDKPRIVSKKYIQHGAASYNPSRKEIGLPAIQQDARLDLILQTYFFGSPLPRNRPFIFNGKLVAETFSLRISRIAHELDHHYQCYPDAKSRTPRQIENHNELISNEIQALTAQYPVFQLPAHSGKALIQIAQVYHEQYFKFAEGFDEQIVERVNGGLAAARALGINERDICLELSACGDFTKQLELLGEWSSLNTEKVSIYLQDIKAQETGIRNLVKDVVLRHVPALAKQF